MTKNEMAVPGIYIHVPFCTGKCTYCDFYSIADSHLISSYIEALRKEVALYQDFSLIFDSLYLGGGTPSLLDAAQLGALVAGLHREFTFAPDSEITLEANPDDLTADKPALYKGLGVNRLSLGVQSFNEGELRFMGRRHTARQTAAAVGRIRDAGFDNLGLDLIYGLPGQTVAAWLKNLETALSFTPEHLSCYQLTVAEATPLGQMVAAGQVRLPDEDTQREFFLRTGEFLTDRGYLHYEVANFAREERFICRHNVKYWTRVPYLGLGPGAHSFDGRRRWWNFSSVADYCASLNAGQAPVAGAETLTPAQIRLETLYLGFRTRKGVGLETIREQPGGDAILTELTQAGLVRVNRDRVIATASGLAVADGLPLWFSD
jgi:oxygen-independent coproporphyrinogen-3 oxidase